MKLLQHKFTLPDWLSFYRIASFPFLLLVLWMGERTLFSWMLLISYSTDAIDGFIARYLKVTSKQGAQLDSVGDQLTFIAGVTGLFVFENEYMRSNLNLMLIAFSPYLLQLIIAMIKYGKPTAFHTYLAKSSAILQGLFILAFLFFGPVYWLFYTMLIVGFLETVEEISLIFLYPSWISDVKGLYHAMKDPRRKMMDEPVKQQSA